jgi:hypothetical protein
LFELLNEDGACQELLRNKYIQSKPLSQVKAKLLDSPFWKGLMKVNDDILKRGSLKIGNGKNTSFLGR